MTESEKKKYQNIKILVEKGCYTSDDDILFLIDYEKKLFI